MTRYTFWVAILVLALVALSGRVLTAVDTADPNSIPPVLNPTTRTRTFIYQDIPPELYRYPDLDGLEKATVNKALDGNTLEVTLNGKREIVRYAGSDAPGVEATHE